MPFRKFGGDFLEQGTDLVFRKRHDPRDDPADPFESSRTEWPQKNARLVGLEDRRRCDVRGSSPNLRQ